MSDPGHRPATGLAAPDRRPRLFLSYSRANGYLAERLHADLEQAGLDCWIDRHGIDALDPNWPATIEAAIAMADECLFLVSPESLASAEVSRELEAAERHGKPIRHLCLTPIPALPQALRRQRQLHDWSCRADDYRTQLQRLLRDLGLAPRRDTDPHAKASPQTNAAGLAVAPAAAAADSRAGAPPAGPAEPLAPVVHPHPLEQLNAPAVQMPLDDLAAASDHLAIGALHLRRCWLDVSPYTRSWLLWPASGPASLPDDPAIVLRFSGSQDRDTLREVLDHRLDAGLSLWVIAIEGPLAAEGSDYRIPNEALHIWRDCIDATARLLNHSAIKRRQPCLYLDAPAALALLLGQRLDRDRPLRLHQFDRRRSRYACLDFTPAD